MRLFLLAMLLAFCGCAYKKPCRVVWVAPTGYKGHGSWISEKDAVDAVVSGNRDFPEIHHSVQCRGKK